MGRTGSKNSSCNRVIWNAGIVSGLFSDVFKAGKGHLRFCLRTGSLAKAKERFRDFFDMDGFCFLTADISLELPCDVPHADYIVHAASLASPQYYARYPAEVIEPNVIGTWNLLRYAKGQKARSFLFFSTGDIYGKVREAGCIDENTMGILNPLDLHSCYGESKRMGETLCAAFYREYGVKTVIARIGHTYGPGMDLANDPRIFSALMKCAVNGTDLILHSDGRTRRPFCYAADATAAFLLLLLRGKHGEAYNVTNTGQFLSILELAQIIASIPKQKLHVRYQERSSLDTYLDNDLNKENKPSEQKLRALGWNPEYDVQTGFSRVYQYFTGR